MRYLVRCDYDTLPILSSIKPLAISSCPFEAERRKHAISRSVSASRWHTRACFYCATKGGGRRKREGAYRWERKHNDRKRSERASELARPRATRCDFWMNRRVAMTHRSRRSPRPINRAERARFGINCRSLKRERSDGGTFDTAVTFVILKLSDACVGFYWVLHSERGKP